MAVIGTDNGTKVFLRIYTYKSSHRGRRGGTQTLPHAWEHRPPQAKLSNAQTALAANTANVTENTPSMVMWTQMPRCLPADRFRVYK